LIVLRPDFVGVDREGMRLSATLARSCSGSISRRQALFGLVATAASASAYALPQRLGSDLPAPVKDILLGSRLPLKSFGLEIRAVDSSVPLVSLQSDQSLVMASTTKLVTALAALDLLGPEYRWTTEAFITGELEGAQLKGDLLVMGGGDPLFSSDELRSWMVEMRKKGLDRIRGDIVLDHSAFNLNDSDHSTTPEPGSDRPHHVRPHGLMMDEGVIQVQVNGRREGPPSVGLVSPLARVRVVNHMTSDPGCSAQFRWSEHKGGVDLIAQGQWDRSCGSKPLPFVPPTGSDVTCRQVESLWRSVGGQLQGRVRQGSLMPYQRDGGRLPLIKPNGELLKAWTTHRSRPLREVLKEVNKSSNNPAARHVMLSLSPGFPQRPATLVAAQERVRRWLSRQGLSVEDLSVDNGSGLSRAERGRPRALVKLLCRAIDRRDSRIFLETLPIAGVDGTLAHRMERGAAAGMAFLKTGTLLDARALAGYVRGKSGKVYAVAALLNHPEAAVGRPALDRVIEWLARSG
jgi:serine-type D-Ala-D-Ala carboxypeptidase/endopeptidase (penicillin-binding protein 4)